MWPGITALTLVYLIAAWAIVTGGMEIAFALAMPDTLAQPWLAALSGLLSVIFGLLLAVWPRAGAVTLIWLVGVYAIVYGATMLYYAYRLQSLGRGVESLRTAGGVARSDRLAQS